MKRLIIKSTILVVIAAILATCLMLSTPDGWSRHSHEINARLAYERLDSLKNCNKVVIIAGSNGSFGFRSEMIEEAFGLPVVNTSANAGVGVMMQFEMYKDLLREGDIVIFCPEYYADKERLYGGSSLFRVLSTHMPEAYLKMTPEHWIHTIKFVGVYFKDALKHILARPFEGPYSASSVDKYGDISYPREHQEAKESYILRGDLDKSATRYYQYIHEFSKQKGLFLIYLPPTLNETIFARQKEQIDAFEAFSAENGIPFQSSPQNYVFHDSLYFDTPYHLTLEGATIRTERVIEDIRNILGR